MQPNKGLIYLVAGLGALIVLGLAAAAVGIVLKTSGSGFSFFGTAAPTFSNAEVMLPPGARVIGITADGGRIHAHIQGGGGASIWTIDPATGKVLGKMLLKSP